MQGIETETAVTGARSIPLGGELAPELIADDARQWRKRQQKQRARHVTRPLGAGPTDDNDDDIEQWAAPGWREAALEYHKHRGNRASISPYAPEHLARLRRLMDDDSPERAWHELNGRSSGAAASTVEALMFALRSRGVQALGEPDVVHRLAQLNDAQLREIAIRLQKLTPHIAPAWAPEDVEVLLAVRSKIDG